MSFLKTSILVLLFFLASFAFIIFGYDSMEAERIKNCDTLGENLNLTSKYERTGECLLYYKGRWIPEDKIYIVLE